MFADPNSRNFDLANNANTLLTGAGNNTGTMWQGVTVFLQYLSENANPLLYPNPNAQGNSPSTISYPDYYFNCHDLNQIMDMINSALYSAQSRCIIADIITATNYFSYDPISQLYTYNVSDKFIHTNACQLFVNGFLQRWLDAFRWQFYNDTNISVVPYDGMGSLFIPTLSNQALLDSSGVWHFPSAYPSVENLITVHSVIITCGGSFASVEQEYTPLPASQGDSANLPALACLKNFDVVFSGNLASVNNTTLTFNVTSLDRPINTGQALYLTDLQFKFQMQDINNNLIDITQPSISSSNIKLCLRKKRKNN